MGQDRGSSTEPFVAAPPENLRPGHSEAGVYPWPDERAGSQRSWYDYIAQWFLSAAPFMATDALAVFAAMNLAAILSASMGSLPTDYVAYMVALAIGLPIAYWHLGLYPGVGLHPVVELRQAVTVTSLVFSILFVATFAASGWTSVPIWVGVLWVNCIVLVPIVRLVARRVFARFSWWRQPVLIFGNGPSARSIYNKLLARPHLGLQPIGLLHESEEDWIADVDADKRVNYPYLGPPALASVICRDEKVFWAVIAMPDHSHSSVAELAERVTTFVPNVLIAHQFMGPSCLWHRAEPFADASCVRVASPLLLPFPRMVKAAVDLTLTVIGGILVLPLIGAIAVLVRATSRGPAFYRSERIGRAGQRIKIWKFRTMEENADEALDRYLDANSKLRAEWSENSKLKIDPRVTRIGRWLRKTSLDELPQIWNVLRGEMSLVGPRPLLDEDVPKYGDGFETYTQVLPGITGLWQVSGRSDTTYRQRVQLDHFYVRNWSLWLDLYILLRTFRALLRADGAY